MNDTSKDVTIQFEPSGIRTTVPRGSRLLDAARTAGVPVPAFCGGHSTCGKCRIRLLSSQDPSSVSEISSVERAYLSDTDLHSGIRLACETYIYSDIIAATPETENTAQAIILTSVDRTAGKIPSPKTRLGAAIDIGSTTLAAYLYDLDSRELLSSVSQMNPQIPYGDDIISRISYCSEDPEHLMHLQSLILDALSGLLYDLCADTGSDVSHIYETVLVGNTVMTHILLGTSPECLGHAPFTPAIKDSVLLPAHDLMLPAHPEGKIYILPAADGFIGADHLAALLKADPEQYPGSSLLIDIGTNSEICLYTDHSYYSTSCATGPALEGATIHCGMHASKGAIDHVSIDPDSLVPTLHVIGQEEDPSAAEYQAIHGICGSGIIDAVADMVTTGILNADGSFSSHADSPYIRDGQSGDKEYLLFQPVDPSRRRIVITQQDIRNVQLAKAALYAGIRLLLEKSDCKKPDRILLAGAFGNYMNVRKALQLGLFPDMDPDCILPIGNAAGGGAILVLLDPALRKKAEKLAGEIHFVESAADAAFPRLYADAMTLPHKRDGFPISNPVPWSCPGEDHHILPDSVYSLPISILEDPETTAALLPEIQKQNRETALFLPLIQNLEACCLGAPVKKMKNYWAPGTYPYKTLDEVEEIDFQLTGARRIQTIFETLRLLKVSDPAPVVVEIEAPFTILAAILEPGVLYAAARRTPDRLLIILKKIADAECAYIDQLIRYGACVLSLADPMGNTGLTGQKTYDALIGPSQSYLLKKSRRYLKKGLIHICGHMAADLIRSGLAVSHPVRLKRDTDYIGNLMELSNDTGIRFMGPGCIRTTEKGLSLGTVLDIL